MFVFLITLGCLLTVNVAVVANLIIVGGAECACVSGTVSLQLSVNSNFAIAMRRVEATRTWLLVYEADHATFSRVAVRVELGVLATAAFGPLGIPHRSILNG